MIQASETTFTTGLSSCTIPFGGQGDCNKLFSDIRYLGYNDRECQTYPICKLKTLTKIKNFFSIGVIMSTRLESGNLPRCIWRDLDWTISSTSLQNLNTIKLRFYLQSLLLLTETSRPPSLDRSSTFHIDQYASPVNLLAISVFVCSYNIQSSMSDIVLHTAHVAGSHHLPTT